jgi:hypothetical protein
LKQIKPSKILVTPTGEEKPSKIGLNVGGMGQHSLKKFNTVFKKYLRYVQEHHSIPIDKKVLSHVQPLNKKDDLIIALNDAQQVELINFKPSNTSDELKHDVCVFLLYSALAVQDFINLDENSFKNHGTEKNPNWFIEGYRQKTGVKFLIPANTVIMDLAKKHNFNFTRLSGEDFTSKNITAYCKSIWQNLETFEETTGVERWNSETERYDVHHVKMKHVFTLHKLRNTCIKNCITLKMSISQIMAICGWSDFKMLQTYLDKYEIKDDKATEGFLTMFK